MSGLFGATAIPIAPGPRPPIRRSSFTRSQDSPPSSERYTPAFLRASTEAYTRLGRLGATAMPMRPRPSALPGSPFVNSCHVSPPSVDLYSPLPLEMNDSPLRISHGATRAAHRFAYTIRAFDGSKTMSAAPVFSSLYRTFCQLRSEEHTYELQSPMSLVCLLI